MTRPRTRRHPRPREHPHCGNARTRQVTDTSNDARAPERAPEHPMTDIHPATRTRPPDAPRPRVVSVLSQKGGTGKTTLSCALAALASRAETATAVLDLDPQASAAKWHDLRRANGEDDPPVFATPSSRMQALVDALGRDGAELIVTDTAPHSGADAVTVARLSDHILIPLQPSFPNLAAITRTIDIAEIAKTPATIVFNLTLVNHPSTDDARTVIAGTAVPVAPVVLHRRVAHVNSFNAGALRGRVRTRREGGQRVPHPLRMAAGHRHHPDRRKGAGGMTPTPRQRRRPRPAAGTGST